VSEEIKARSEASAVEAARTAIWRLFEEGYVDEDMATASLLAVDLGTRRARQKRTPPAVPAHPVCTNRRGRPTNL
jgi:hypothetical protein